MDSSRQQRTTVPWGTVGRVLRLAAPLALVQLGNQALSAVDTAFAGRLDATALAATGIGSSIFFAVSGLGIGLAIALDPLIARALGGGYREKARHTLWSGLALIACASLPLMGLVAAVVVNLEPMGVGAAIADQVRAYTWARLPSLLPLLLSIGLRSWLQANRSTGPIVVAVLVTNVINVLADALLIHGDAALNAVGLDGMGLAAQGVAGIGWASTAASTVQLAITVAYCRGALPIRLHDFSAVAATILRLGVPISLHVAVEIAVFSAMHVLAGGMGELPSAAHQTALTLAAASFSIYLGIGAATSVEVAHAVGADSPAEARRAGYAGISLGAVVMVFFALTMWMVPEHLARLFTDDPQVVHLAGQLLRIAAAFQLVDGIQTVASGALRGLGDTRFSFLVNLVAHWGLGLPLGVWLALVADLGVAGLWWGVTVSLSVVAVALLWRFRRLARTLQT